MSARILIVEDEEPLTMLLRYNLEAEGYEVDSATRGDDADARGLNPQRMRTNNNITTPHVIYMNIRHLITFFY